MKQESIDEIQRRKAIIMGLFIAKFSEKAYESFGFSTYKEAYNVFGYSVGFPPASIKNYQQEFDRFFPNGREGWKRPVRDYCKSIFDEYKDLTFEEFQRLVNSIVLDEYVDIKDFKSKQKQTKKRQFSTNRMMTGKAAEEYFVMNYKGISPFQNYLLTDTTNMGCGFDYKLSLDSENYYVEVKGISERHGSILMTEKEFNMAEDLLERYCLFIVSNFREIPMHQLFFDPLHSKDLQFVRNSIRIQQIQYKSNII
ncbi:MAG: DUF3883 domain-containing protein [Aeriscardovia sp.]|nr:DUF3883 domain-containing protein [Aeriscardovia sp.]